MEIIRDRKIDFAYSLHDSRIKNIYFKASNLIMELDYIFEYSTKGEEFVYEAEIIFTDCIDDSCYALIYDDVLGEGSFSGKRLSLIDFIKNYKHQEFEIITEVYTGCNTIFTGWLWENQKPVSAQLELWNNGEIIYKVSK